MHSYKKLVVCGCSVSDRHAVDLCYGDKLAEYLDCEYDHQGKICGSNDRIFRIATNKIISGEINTDTLLVIQYTTLTRREFWTSNGVESTLANNGMQIVDPYGDWGQLVHQKTNSYTWQTNPETAKFFQQYEEQFVDWDYNREVFRAQHYNFYHQLKRNRIPTVFLAAWGYFPSGSGEQLYFENPEEVLYITKHNLDSKYQMAVDDMHFNTAGHIEVADRLYQHIKNL